MTLYNTILYRYYTNGAHLVMILANLCMTLYGTCVTIYNHDSYMLYTYRFCEAYTNILGLLIYILLGGEKRFKSSKSGKNKKIRNSNAILIILKWSYTPLNNLEPRAYSERQHHTNQLGITWYFVSEHLCTIMPDWYIIYVVGGITSMIREFISVIKEVARDLLDELLEDVLGLNISEPSGLNDTKESTNRSEPANDFISRFNKWLEAGNLNPHYNSSHSSSYSVNLDIIRRILGYYKMNLDDDTVAASKLIFRNKAEAKVYYEYFIQECSDLFDATYDEICLPDGYELGIRLMPKNDNIVIRLRRYEIDHGNILKESTLNLYTE